MTMPRAQSTRTLRGAQTGHHCDFRSTTQRNDFRDARLDVENRKVICSANAIEGVSAHIRKAVRAATSPAAN
jgi:transposase-like protein